MVSQSQWFLLSSHVPWKSEPQWGFPRKQPSLFHSAQVPRHLASSFFLGVLMHHRGRYVSICVDVLQFFHLYDRSLQHQGEKCPSLFNVTVANTLPVISVIVLLRRTVPGGKTPSWKCDMGGGGPLTFCFYIMVWRQKLRHVVPANRSHSVLPYSTFRDERTVY